MKNNKTPLDKHQELMNMAFNAVWLFIAIGTLLVISLITTGITGFLQMIIMCFVSMALGVYAKTVVDFEDKG